MLADKVILYDDSCPMCRLYTWWFVAWGFLRPENRLQFSQAPPEIISQFDLDRARHEIPLFDRSTGQTIYGLDALTLVLADRWRWLKPISRTVLFRWIFYPLYQIITYNRRIISGCAACNGVDCGPDLNRFYRSVYLLLATGFITAIVLFLFLTSVPSAIAGAAMIVSFAFVGSVTGLIVRLSSGTIAAWDYFGNCITVVLMIATVLIPLSVWTSMPGSLTTFLLLTALILGLGENRRRHL